MRTQTDNFISYVLNEWLPIGRKRSTSQHGNTSTQTLARGLGWFSIGLGLLELAAPRTVTRTLGMRGSEGLVQFYGLRELAAGIGILSTSNPAPWLWGRVGGDALDIATLANGLDAYNRKRGNVALALTAVLGVTILDVMCAREMSRQASRPGLPIRDYSNRRGMPRSPEEMRGSARELETPKDLRIPEALRPYTSARSYAPADAS